jgi:hypothetical protein
LNWEKSSSKVKKDSFRDDGVAEASPFNQAGWSDCIIFVRFIFSFAISV